VQLEVLPRLEAWPSAWSWYACEFADNRVVLRGVPQMTRITRAPAVMGGRPCIRGMRVTVGTVVALVAAGRTRDEILREYPYLRSSGHH
jgi:uncharacterized protein (DUF433 family)